MKFFKRKKVIVREDGKPYLVRWNLFECRWFSIKLHRILISDDDCLHDHPWSFISIILRGGYVEQSEKSFKLYGVGSILFRKATWKHRLIIYQPATTLVITFKRVRSWGFWTKQGWIHWANYKSTGQCD